MCQAGKCDNCNKCNPCSCGEYLIRFFVETLPVKSQRCPHAIYFVKPQGETTVTTYIIDKDKNAYLVGEEGGGGSDIKIESPLNTILVSKVGDTYKIDVSSSSMGQSNIIESITLNGNLLPVSSKNVDIDVVETVTGNLVDNTDPANPEISFRPTDYDLEDFENNGTDPYLKQSDLGNIDHNATDNKQGGNGTDEYYHLDETEYDYLIDIVSNDTIGTILNAIVEHPDYVAPTSSITNVTQLAEVGSSLSIAITQTFSQNDAGAKTSETITKNTSTVSTTNTFNETLAVPTTPVVYAGTVSYADGVTKNNNLGVPDPIGKILAGTVNSPSRTVTPIYPIFYGVFNTQPDASTLTFSGMTKMVVSGQNTITVSPTSTDSQWVVVAIPSSYPTKTVWYVDALNQGAIGGSSNLFGTSSTHLKNSPSLFWTGIAYRIYITNYPSAINTIELRNS